MKFTEKSVTTQLEILKRKLGGELFEEIKLDDTAFTEGVCKAGNPIAVDGKVDKETKPIGNLQMFIRTRTLTEQSLERLEL